MQPIPGWALVRLTEDEVTVLDEPWPLEALLRFPSWHSRAQPIKADVPLVVFRGWGQLRLIDGYTRINYWRQKSDIGPHRVLVVEPRVDVQDPFPFPPP